MPLPGLGIMFGRIGNFINGELWGKPTTLPWGFKYNGEVLHPSQLYEALLEGLVLFVLHLVVHLEAAAALAPTGLFLLYYGTRARSSWSSCACPMSSSDISPAAGSRWGSCCPCP